MFATLVRMKPKHSRPRTPTVLSFVFLAVLSACSESKNPTDIPSGGSIALDRDAAFDSPIRSGGSPSTGGTPVQPGSGGSLATGGSPLIDGLKAINPNVLVGAHVDPSIATMADTDKYKSIVLHEFSASQALWYGAWGSWPSNGQLDFSRLSVAINWLKANHISPHVHMLVGQDLYAPDWLKTRTWTAAELETILLELVNQAMDTNDNKAKVDVWNLVNEILRDEDGTYRKDVVWNQMGWEPDQSGLTGEERPNAQHPLFLRKVFQFARAKTTSKLEYRDYLIEINRPDSTFHKKHKAAYQMLKHMLNSGIPVDAIGIQGHHRIDDWNFRYATEKQALVEIVRKFKSLGIEVYITEMDIGVDPTKDAFSDEKKERQSANYYEFVKQAILGGAIRIYSWGFQDGRDPTWLTKEHPLPWDENLEKKPAYFGWQKALIETK